MVGSDDESQPLADVMRLLARGIFPEPDGLTEILPRPLGAVAAVLSFTGHHIVAADVSPEWVESYCPPGDLLAPIGPRFISALTEQLGRQPGPVDLVWCAGALQGVPGISLQESPAETSHSRAQRARRVRTDVRIYTLPGGEALLAVGRGLAGRWEAAFEVEPQARNQGLGRALVRAARHLIPPGETLFMQVAVGNIASLRAVLAGGFLPVGAEILFLSSC